MTIVIRDSQEAQSEHAHQLCNNGQQLCATFRSRAIECKHLRYVHTRANKQLTGVEWMATYKCGRKTCSDCPWLCVVTSSAIVYDVPIEQYA